MNILIWILLIYISGFLITFAICTFIDKDYRKRDKEEIKVNLRVSICSWISLIILFAAYCYECYLEKQDILESKIKIDEEEDESL